MDDDDSTVGYTGRSSQTRSRSSDAVDVDAGRVAGGRGERVALDRPQAEPLAPVEPQVADAGAALVALAAIWLVPPLLFQPRAIPPFSPVAVSTIGMPGLVFLFGGGGWSGGTWSFLAGLLLVTAGLLGLRTAVLDFGTASVDTLFAERPLWELASEHAADVHPDRPAELGICRREGEARLRAIRHELMRDPHELASIELLTRVAERMPGKASAADMRKWHDELVSWAAGRLGLLFAATVVEFFDPATVATRIGEAESPEAAAKGLATLAAARQSLAVSPGLALAYVTRFREGWGLVAG